MSGSFRAGGPAGFARPRPHRVFNGSALLAYPYLYSDYDGYHDYDYEAPEAPPVQVVLAPQPAPSSATAASPIEPMLLEYHDGRWVRVTTDGQPSDHPQATQPNSGAVPGVQGAAAPAKAPQPVAELPPAVLVFRDGHSEEVKKYTIKGDVIYASADYWSTGSWTRNIPVAALDIPATLKANADRGAKFSLPSGPNEIVMRF
jgi:hypothetical protein